MCFFEEKWVITGNARPSICFKYVDDPLTKYGSNDSINFTIEIEKSTKFPSSTLKIRTLTTPTPYRDASMSSFNGSISYQYLPHRE